MTNIEAVLEALGEAINAKNEEIKILKWKLDLFEKENRDLEKEIAELRERKFTKDN